MSVPAPSLSNLSLASLNDQSSHPLLVKEEMPLIEAVCLDLTALKKKGNIEPEDITETSRKVSIVAHANLQRRNTELKILDKKEDHLKDKTFIGEGSKAKYINWGLRALTVISWLVALGALIFDKEEDQNNKKGKIIDITVLVASFALTGFTSYMWFLREQNESKIRDLEKEKDKIKLSDNQITLLVQLAQYLEGVENPQTTQGIKSNVAKHTKLHPKLQENLPTPAQLLHPQVAKLDDKDPIKQKMIEMRNKAAQQSTQDDMQVKALKTMYVAGTSHLKKHHKHHHHHIGRKEKNRESRKLSLSPNTARQQRSKSVPSLEGSTLAAFNESVRSNNSENTQLPVMFETRNIKNLEKDLRKDVKTLQDEFGIYLPEVYLGEGIIVGNNGKAIEENEPIHSEGSILLRKYEDEVAIDIPEKQEEEFEGIVRIRGDENV